MTRDSLVKAMNEARRFLDAAQIALDQDQSSYDRLRDTVPYGAKAAAAKRASMDLTKALAVARRSDG